MKQDDPAERIRQGRNRAKEKSGSKTSKTSNTSDTSNKSKSNLKGTRKAVQIYIPDELKSQVEKKRLELQGKLGREIEKNRELWPLVIEKGLEALTEDDFSEGDTGE